MTAQDAFRNASVFAMLDVTEADIVMVAVYSHDGSFGVSSGGRTALPQHIHAAFSDCVRRFQADVTRCMNPMRIDNPLGQGSGFDPGSN